MNNKQLKMNIKSIDFKIALLSTKLTSEDSDMEYRKALTKIEDLTKVRCQLAASLQESSNKGAVISGLFGVAGIVIVLKYEEKEVITSKAFSMLTGLFRGA